MINIIIMVTSNAVKSQYRILKDELTSTNRHKNHCHCNVLISKCSVQRKKAPMKWQQSNCSKQTIFIRPHTNKKIYPDVRIKTTYKASIAFSRITRRLGSPRQLELERLYRRCNILIQRQRQLNIAEYFPPLRSDNALVSVSPSAFAQMLQVHSTQCFIEVSSIGKLYEHLPIMFDQGRSFVYFFRLLNRSICDTKQCLANMCLKQSSQCLCSQRL